MTVLTKMVSGDPKVDALQDRVGDSFRRIATIAEGLTLQRVQLTAGITNIIPHKLGRKLEGWMLVRARGNGGVYDVQDANSSPETTLHLMSTTNLNVDLYVY